MSNKLDKFNELCRKPGGLRKAVHSALSPEFLYFEEFADITSRALLGESNLLLTGPGATVRAR
jgi:hypothetical protein